MKTNHWYLPCLIIGGATAWFSSGCVVAALEQQQQQVFMHHTNHNDVTLHGRYLHITDIHVIYLFTNSAVN